MMTRQMFGMPTMLLEENPAEGATNHFVVLPKDALMIRNTFQMRLIHRTY
jgi:hypothetical protein